MFNSCVDELEQGKRLENLSWRTWSRERTLYSWHHHSRLPLPLLDDETGSQSPLLTEDDGGDSSSSGSDSGSDEFQSRQQLPRPPHTTDLAPLPSVTPPVTPVTPVPTPVAAPPVAGATAAQSTDSQQQYTQLVTTPTATTSPPRQPQQRHHHKCSASHPATRARPKLVAKPRHYSHSHAAVAASAVAASASPPIGQLIKTVIFNESAIMTAMTHGASTSFFLSPSVCLRPVPSDRCHLLAAGALLPRDSLFSTLFSRQPRYAGRVKGSGSSG